MMAAYNTALGISYHFHVGPTSLTDPETGKRFPMKGIFAHIHYGVVPEGTVP